jgi:hypothetical protein
MEKNKWLYIIFIIIYLLIFGSLELIGLRNIEGGSKGEKVVSSLINKIKTIKKEQTTLKIMFEDYQGEYIIIPGTINKSGGDRYEKLKPGKVLLAQYTVEAGVRSITSYWILDEMKNKSNVRYFVSEDKKLEFGLGPVLSLFKGSFYMGVGWNVSTSRQKNQYALFGISISEITTILKGNISK